MKIIFANTLSSARILLAFSLAFTAMMAGVYALTEEIVRHNRDQAREQLIAQVLPTGSYDNLLLKDNHILPSSMPLLGKASARAYIARKSGHVIAAVIESTAPDGYAGQIALLVAVSPDQRILGVRAVEHKETPGLGDYIDLAKSNWIRLFEGKSGSSPPINRWKVRKDGGDFDYVVGATVTPRAVIKSVKNTLRYVAENHSAVFER